MAKRAQRDTGVAGGAPGAMSDEDALKAARTAGKDRIARSGPTCAPLRGLTAAMKLDLLLFGHVESGPFFALLERTSSPEPPEPPGFSDLRPPTCDEILYSAIDQTVPGTKGGSVHVAAVAEGLSALGHDVTALVTPGPGEPRPSGVRWVPMTPPFGSTHLRLARSGAIAQLARHAAGRGVERYHNFGGEGLLAAPRRRRPHRARGERAGRRLSGLAQAHRGSPARRRADAALARMAMPRRRSDRHDRSRDPAAGHAGREGLETEWGADTVRFHPGAAGRCRSRASPATRSRCSPAPSAPGTASDAWSTR